ncbi:MAG: hypothetical protein M1812_002743 [Candelaria pacifica]|nr:MAG: hypothetical protein M1812_002743 [Candelaria pacifica]
MQEHIRRAHPEHYISKLPATEESFALMINTPPTERPPLPPLPPLDQETEPPAYGHDRNAFYEEEKSGPGTPRALDETSPSALLPAASAAAALAQLHYQRPDSDWEDESEIFSENETRAQRMASSSRPSERAHAFGNSLMPPNHGPRPRELLPSILSRSNSGRSSTLPPIQRKEKVARPRKSSITQNARKPKHERHPSKGHARRMSYEGRKAFSAEPQTAASDTESNRRWADLIDAATSATEEVDDENELTPVPQSPPTVHRSSLPPFQPVNYNSYHASPLQHALTPPPPDPSGEPEPFPSVESSLQSSIESTGSNFHMPAGALDPDSSPTYSHAIVQIYCAACGKVSALKNSYACTECICGICQECADVLIGQRSIGPIKCPRCYTVGARFKPFQLNFR